MFNHTSASEDASDSDLSLCGACETDGGPTEEAPEEAKPAAPEIASQRLTIFRQGMNRPHPAESVKPAS